MRLLERVSTLIRANINDVIDCAEDPEKGFLPSSGQLALLEWPQGEGVRVDAGFGTGDRVPDAYDSLLGKVIAHGRTRNEAPAATEAPPGTGDEP